MAAEKSAGKLRQQRKLASRDAWYGYLFIAPQMIGYFVFVLGPLLAVFYYSLQSRNLLTGQSVFVGFENYQTMFAEDPLFLKTMRNSLVFAAGLVPLNVIGSLGLAMLLSKAVRGISFFRAAFFLPVVTSAVAWAIVWRFMLQDTGTLNQLLQAIGIEGPRWLRDPNWAMLSVIVTRALKGMGINMIILLAAIKNIPNDYYEAALVDGATGWQAFRRITLPLLSPAIFLVTMLVLINSFKVFDTIFLMTRGGPANSTLVLVYYVYYQAFQFFETGYASALSVMLFAVTLVLAVVQWSLRRRLVFNEQ